MTDRAINFAEIVDSIRGAADSSDSDAQSTSTSIVTVAATDPVDVCRALFDRLESNTDTDTDAAAPPAEDRAGYEFYMSHNTRREMERRLVKHGPEAASMDFLECQIRTDVSMPDETVLFTRPDAVTLGGTITGESAIGVGTISSATGAETEES
ncbi:hypothetical protein [Natronolimnohabitans innermongolicus]|uniref:Uncharacterized protein n=1 Tax=Natronolimnohabitans innermongolicus JCM 12255 TaxID=1227499 RepID=L9X7K7_9EURY|nr:hypothetical protein [Natronolimnohabitans innermongolicus]ELY57572.1 hypothetical protein C493_08811 [Natronolimnohabitans innermongolicus JCM 12255]